MNKVSLGVSLVLVGIPLAAFCAVAWAGMSLAFAFNPKYRAQFQHS